MSTSWLFTLCANKKEKKILLFQNTIAGPFILVTSPGNFRGTYPFVQMMTSTSSNLNYFIKPFGTIYVGLVGSPV